MKQFDTLSSDEKLDKLSSDEKLDFIKSMWPYLTEWQKTKLFFMFVFGLAKAKAAHFIRSILTREAQP